MCVEAFTDGACQEMMADTEYKLWRVLGVIKSLNLMREKHDYKNKVTERTSQANVMEKTQLFVLIIISNHKSIFKIYFG